MDKQSSEKGSQFTAVQIQDAARKGVEQGYAMSKQVLDVWATSTEATLKASFDLQNAVIDAGRSLMGPAGNPNQAMYQQWADSVRMAQKATLDALEATKKLTKQFEPKTEPGAK